ncbi:MAG: hypoxanthine phosphoribosyltransferase [bacterium]|nr:hypoxanthine phosphoribosyltransferase [bacterium]
MTDLKVVFTADEIRKRVLDIANRIAEDYQDSPIVLVGILKGAAFFLADLSRAMPTPVDFEFVDVTASAGDRGEVVSLTYATHFNVQDKHVLILKDVLHSGVTENYLITHLSQQHPASIEVLALVDKPQLRSVNVNAKYSVFADVPEGFLVGYGLGGSMEQYTNQPDLCLLEEA